MYICTPNLLRMKRLLYIALTFVALTLPSMKCEAQLSLVLVLCMPGAEAIVSDLPENVFLNGVKIEADETAACQNCGELYRLTSNEVIEEYLKENPDLFGSDFSDDILRKAFICNMEFARRMYPSPMRPPIPGKNEKETVKRAD